MSRRNFPEHTAFYLINWLSSSINSVSLAYKSYFWSKGHDLDGGEYKVEKCRYADISSKWEPDKDRTKQYQTFALSAPSFPVHGASRRATGKRVSQAVALIAIYRDFQGSLARQFTTSPQRPVLNYSSSNEICTQ